jgi:hypothetical protein
MGRFDFQWKRNGLNLTQATYASLEFPAARLGDAGAYQVQVTSSSGSLLSAEATLSVSPAVRHSVDVDRGGRISLSELTRMIELFNTRTGTVRTGAYRVDPGAEDGFAAAPSRGPGVAVILERFHSADTATNGSHDGRIDLFELTGSAWGSISTVSRRGET